MRWRRRIYTWSELVLCRRALKNTDITRPLLCLTVRRSGLISFLIQFIVYRGHALCETLKSAKDGTDMGLKQRQLVFSKFLLNIEDARLGPDKLLSITKQNVYSLS